MNPDDARHAAIALVGDARLVALRMRACSATVMALGAAASYLTIPYAVGNERVRGLAIVVAASAELSSAATVEFNSARWYAGLSLVRQLIETEYLLTVFADDPSEAATWLSSSKAELRHLWNPRRMREKTKGQFDGREYWSHCERGGHPTPLADLTLTNVNQTFDQRFWWIDLAGHLRRVFLATEASFHAFGFNGWLGGQPHTEAHRALSEWKAEDPAPGFILENMRGLSENPPSL